MKGSMTVEASFIVPFCLGVIGVICYLGLFTYNRAVLRLTAFECIGQAAEKREYGEKAVERELTRLLEEKASERAWSLGDIRISVKIDRFSVYADITAVQKLIFSQPVRAEVTYRILHPETVLRAAAAGRRKT